MLCSADEVNEIVLPSSNKSSGLNLVPTGLLKKDVDQQPALITAIIDKSMAKSVAESALDKEHIVNSQPKSELFISKLRKKRSGKTRGKYLTKQWNVLC